MTISWPPRTWVQGELVTAAMMNEQIRDSVLALYPYTATGDLAYRAAINQLTKLAIGGNGYSLIVDAGVPSWKAYERVIHWRIAPKDVAVSAGDGQDYMFIPDYLNGYNLVSAHACIDTVSTSGVVAVQIHNATDAVDMLSTEITIDKDETTSYTAATPPVIDTAHDDVATGDRIRIDVDDVGTGTKGLVVILAFALP